MEIFTNWIFWVALAAVIFIFALIGFLSEKKKKGKTEEVKSETKEVLEPVKNDVSNPGEILNSAEEGPHANSDFTVDTVNEEKSEESQDIVLNLNSSESSDVTVEDTPALRNQVSMDIVNMNDESATETSVDATNQVQEVNADVTNQVDSPEEVSVNIVPNEQGVQDASSSTGNNGESSVVSDDVWKQ